MERLLSKEEILEIYANKLFLGYGSYGIGAAAQRFFNKPVGQLEIHECALIAGMFQSPSRYNPHRYPDRAKTRQLQVLTAMFQAGYLTRDQTLAESKKPLEYAAYKPMNEQVAPYFVDYVREETERLIGKSVEGRGLRIYTTLDPQLQALAHDVFGQSQDIFDKANGFVIPDYRKHKRGELPTVEGALLTIEPTTGEILTMVGGRNYQESKFNRTWQAKRQPGSAFKPIVYSLALNEGHRWSDMMFVSPVAIGGYRPKNFSAEYLSETTLLQAFYMSMNTATVEIGAKIGLDKIIAYAKELGIQAPLKEEPGTMLGSSEVTMMDLARVYSVFANYGRRADPFSIREIRDSNDKVLYRSESTNALHQVITPQVAFLTLQGMREVMARGTATKAGHLASLAAGKTGTSNEAVDNWFAGFTSNLLTIVWIGVDKQLTMSNKATGGELALPIWDRFMTQAINTRKNAAFWQPDDVVRLTIDPKYGHMSSDGIPMWFLSSNRPAESATAEYKALEERPVFRSLFMH
jgi:penicillin-binding protein 1A